MDNTTKNKVIAAFMGIVWYDSYVACRDHKLDLFELQSGLLSSEGKVQLWQELGQQHQWQPEFHNSYDKLIPVAIKLRADIFLAFGYCEAYNLYVSRVDLNIWHSNKAGLFDHLYETILQFNQLTKNKGNGETDKDSSAEIQQTK